MGEHRRSEANAKEDQSFVPPSAAPSSSALRRLTLDAHRDYYAAGGYDIARLTWTLDEFFPAPKNLNVLEIGCGDGAMLQLLAGRGAKAQGMDASESGIARCQKKGLAAQ
jgi:2-polyprenyl-3-methyl-5-hydroxy-6-metoxy-1,4-benzoquinol methylase